MGYFCLKPCRLSGHNYSAGDDIPAEAVAPGSRGALVEMGFIAAADNSGYASVTLSGAGDTDKIYITLLSKTEEQDVAVPLTCAETQAIFNMLQLNAEEAAEYIKNGTVTSHEALELLSRIDQRKAVKAAVKERMEEGEVL